MQANNISKIAIGTAQFGMPYGIANKNGQVLKVQAAQILDFAHRNGIKTIDTAKCYGNSEETIGYYFRKGTVQNWSIITKVNNNEMSLSDQVNDSINMLSIIPKVVLSHSVRAYLNPNFCDELHKLKEIEGVKQVGVSVYTNSEIQKILFSRLPDVIQCPLNILDTKLYRNGIFNEMKAKKMDIHIRSVFLQGMFYLSDKDIQENFPDVFETINQLQIIAQDADLTLAELSLLWVCSLEQVDKVIIGVDNVEQLNAHMETIKKKVDPVVFEEALSIKYENENILNPSLWLSKS